MQSPCLTCLPFYPATPPNRPIHLLPLFHHSSKAWQLVCSSTKGQSMVGGEGSVEQKMTLILLKQLGMEEEALRKCMRHVSEISCEAELMKLMATLRFVGMKRADLRSLLSNRPSLLGIKPARVECMFRCFSGLGFHNSKTIKIWVQWPALIDSDVENIKDTIHYLISVGVPTEEVIVVLSRRPQILAHDSRRVRLVVSALHHAGMSQAEIVTLLKRVPGIFSTPIQEVHASLSFWSGVSVEGNALCKALIWRPNLLNYDIKKMKVNYQFLQRWVKPGDLKRLTRKYAEALSFDSEKKLEPSIAYLLGLGVKDEVIGKVIARRPQLLACTISGLEKTVSYLKSLGMTDDMIGKIVTISPQVLTLNSDEKLKQGIEFFQSIGLDKEKNMTSFFLRNAQIICCSIDNNLRPKIDFLTEIGLSKEAITNMVVRFPSMLGHSIDNSLQPKYNYLVNVMNRPVQELSIFPQYFGYSLDRIKRRHDALQKNGIHRSLASMLACTDDDFHKRYIIGLPSSRIKQRTK